MSETRSRLAQHVQAAHLALREFCQEFHDAGLAIGENAHVSERQAKRWLAGDAELPRAQARRVLEHWFGEPITVLFGPPRGAGPAMVRTTPEELLMTTGRESAEHALRSAASLEPAALEALHAEVARLARAYYTAAPLTLLAELVRLRDTVYGQIERTHKPRQRAELYMLAGTLCGLLSSIAFDLGHRDSAEELARAAYTYGSVIDHPSLCTWARALTMSVLLWSDQYREVVAVATRAAELAPAGTSRGRLYAVRARALAHLGAAREAAEDLALSAIELDRAGTDELMDGIGGELGFDRTRRALCAGSAYVALHDGDRGQAEAGAALLSFAAQPDGSRWRAGELAARVDLSTARALSGDLAGAEQALGEVLVLPAEHRTEALTQRLDYLGRLVGAKYRGAIEAGRIGDAVADFTAHALPRSTATLELPAPPALSST
ncbi:hypothetical protein [Amycolatopsis sp. NPDC059021]|uniref:hypothetical protein n=1 Tax=Amycolatopsis sp. NPDC059021 TaxID=3346704 RepID=UPI00366A829A